MLTALRTAAVAHGGPLARSELAAWLATRFARELAQQRTIIDRATRDIGDDTATRVLILHRATGRAAADAPAEAAEATDTVIDAPLEVANDAMRDPIEDVVEAPLPHVTEQLAPAPPRIRRRRRRAVIGIAALALVATAAVALIAVHGGDRTGMPDRIATTHAGDEQRDPEQAAGGRDDEVRASDGVTSHRNDEGRAADSTSNGARCASVDSSHRRTASAQAEPSPSEAQGDASARTAPTAPAVTKAAAPVTASRPPRVERPKPTRHVVEVPDGTIRIDSQPAYATIEIDGRRVGVTPIKSWKLSAGRHRVHARCVDGREQDRDVEIRSDEQTNVPLTW
jgi:hypothetical protein